MDFANPVGHGCQINLAQDIPLASIACCSLDSIFLSIIYTTMPAGFALSRAARGGVRKSVSMTIASPLESLEASKSTTRSHQAEHDFARQQDE